MASGPSWGPRRLQRVVAALVTAGLLGIATELLLIGHVESATQLVPVVVLPITAALLAPVAIGTGPRSPLALRVTLGAAVAAGLAGVALHLYESWEFQKEIDPSLDGTARALAALRAQSPPSLAPAQIALLGLLGLAVSGPDPASNPSAVNKEP